MVHRIAQRCQLLRWAARNKTTLQSLNITHILNAADGPYSINTGAKYYSDLQIEYYGIEAFDDPSFDLSIFFYDAANFIGKALNTSGGKVFVHCAMGISRSASLVLAFLMIHENMTLVDALKTDTQLLLLFPSKNHPGDGEESASEEEGGFSAEAPKRCTGNGSGCRKAFDNKTQGFPNLPDSSTL
ncbi:dual specificity phosphatase 29-like isoform X3 [Struthio camelus]|uniref:dual specificity phosphatase 29-like isoform X3 n=1 Tax=Struthio camelus TaxID=8801 RepID=UPI003603B91D